MLNVGFAPLEIDGLVGVVTAIRARQGAKAISYVNDAKTLKNLGNKYEDVLEAVSVLSNRNGNAARLAGLLVDKSPAEQRAIFKKIKGLLKTGDGAGLNHFIRTVLKPLEGC
jgi:hypothetical protein